MKTLDGNNCFSLTNNNNYQVTTSSSEWWSTSTLSFSITNNCTNAQFINNLNLIIEGWQINNKPIYQQGTFNIQVNGTPYLNVTNSITSDKITLTINTQQCSGEWCDWAKVQPNSIHTINLLFSLGGPINSSVVNSIYLEGSAPVTPGTLIITVNTSQIYSLNNNSISPVIQIFNNSTGILTNSFQLVPSLTSTIQQVALNPGNYLISVDPNSIPILTSGKIDFNINPNLISITSNSQMNSNINFVYTADNGNHTTTLGIGGYYQSWSANWQSNPAALSLANIPSYVSHILIAFADPRTNYQAGSNTFGGTGLQFSSDFSVVKNAISIGKQKNPNQIFLLSFGGATYPWQNANYLSIIALMNDLGADGIDIDLENQPTCSGVNTDNLSCNTDQTIIDIITNLKSNMPSGKLLTAAAFSVGAYGTSNFPTTKYGPGSAYSGMWVNPLKAVGSKLDKLFIMSYDASPVYSPTDAFNAYKSIYPNGQLYLGLEVPPEAWGGYVLTVDDAKKFASYVQNNNGNGVFIWSLEKNNGSTNSMTFLQPICLLYGLNDCDKNIPFN
jgi:chitinase